MFTVMVQLPPGVPPGIVLPPTTSPNLPPATAVTTALPPQVVLAPGVAAITTPAGNVSMSTAVSVAVVAFWLVKVIVSAETPPTPFAVRAECLAHADRAGRRGRAERGVDGIGPRQRHGAGVVVSILPLSTAFGPMLLVPVRATTFPAKDVPPIVAELPTCHHTLHAWAPARRSMFDVEIVTATARHSEDVGAVAAQPENAAARQIRRANTVDARSQILSGQLIRNRCGRAARTRQRRGQRSHSALRFD